MAPRLSHCSIGSGLRSSAGKPTNGNFHANMQFQSIKMWAPLFSDKWQSIHLNERGRCAGFCWSSMIFSSILMTKSAILLMLFPLSLVMFLPSLHLVELSTFRTSSILVDIFDMRFLGQTLPHFRHISTTKVPLGTPRACTPGLCAWFHGVPKKSCPDRSIYGHQGGILGSQDPSILLLLLPFAVVRSCHPSRNLTWQQKITFFEQQKHPRNERAYTIFDSQTATRVDSLGCQPMKKRCRI